VSIRPSRDQTGASDFGSTKLAKRQTRILVNARLKPKYGVPALSKNKVDVFSFGLVLHEMLIGFLSYKWISAISAAKL
jgi:hypothetical protein